MNQDLAFDVVVQLEEIETQILPPMVSVANDDSSQGFDSWEAHCSAEATMDHLFANFGGKAAASDTPPAAAAAPAASSSSKKRQISPAPTATTAAASSNSKGTAASLDDSSAPVKVRGVESISAKKAKLASSSTGGTKRDTAAPIVTDDIEIEAKREVVGSVGLGGGEAAGLILSHAVRSLSCPSLPFFFGLHRSTLPWASRLLPYPCRLHMMQDCNKAYAGGPDRCSSKQRDTISRF